MTRLRIRLERGGSVVDGACRVSSTITAVAESIARSRSATSGSWVISTTVRPSALSWPKIASTSALELRVEVAGRLVGQDERRVGDDAPRDRDPLLLAAGELVREVVGRVSEPDRGQRRHRSVAALGPLDAAVDERQLDVRQRGGARDEVEALEDEADFGGCGRQRAGISVELS